jgi:hypothetical protein
VFLNKVIIVFDLGASPFYTSNLCWFHKFRKMAMVSICILKHSVPLAQARYISLISINKLFIILFF